jgi:hypothetical protein
MVNRRDLEMTTILDPHLYHQSVLAVVPAETVELRMNISKLTFHTGDSSRGDD